MKRLATLLLMLVTMTSCFVDTEYNTLYTIKPLEQLESAGEYTTLSGVVAYAFEADTVTWGVESYENALNGVITNRENGEEMTPVSVSEPYEGTFENMVAMQLPFSKVMVLVVDTINKGYAFTEYEIGEGVAQTFVTVIFRTWKNTAAYRDGSWYFVPTIVETPEPDPDVTDPDEGTQNSDN